MNDDSFADLVVRKDALVAKVQVWISQNWRDIADWSKQHGYCEYDNKVALSVATTTIISGLCNRWNDNDIIDFVLNLEQVDPRVPVRAATINMSAIIEKYME